MVEKTPDSNERETQETFERAGIDIDPQNKPQGGVQSKRESEGDALPRLRTYSADMNDAIKKRGATLSSIISAEKTSADKKPRVSTTPSPKGKNVALIVGTFALLVLGSSALIFTFFITEKNANEQEARVSVISPNKVLRVPYSSTLTTDLGEIRKNTDVTLGEMLRLDIYEGQVFASHNQILEALRIPEALRRETKDVMLGIHSFDRNQPFIILSVSAYDRSFNALLEWEDEIARSLGSFFAPLGETGNPPIVSFSDGVVQNIDIRKSQSGWPILYGYVTRNVLVITTNEFTLREILSRFSSVRP